MSSTESQVSRLETLRSLYGAGYFHGANSGYPKEGYALKHPDWEPWLERIKQLLSSGSRWLDLGCAYGFLVERARAKGYRAVGCDISRFALTQNSALQEYLSEADALALPFRSGSLDLITAFDVLEHLEDPVQAIREIYRCLTPEGLAIVTTPDPCRFAASEPTHVSEKPPAHWIALFQKNGFFCDFGFEGADYNLVLASSKSRSRVENFHRILLHTHPLKTVESPEATVTARVRAGFHHSADGWTLGEQNELYILNSSEDPVTVSLTFQARTTGHNGVLLLLADGRVVRQFEFLSTCREFACEQEDIFLPSGGHSLRLQLGDGSTAGQITLGPIALQGRQISPQELISRLPFDLFERYYAAALFSRRLARTPETVLDFGGYIGDQGGHWADASNFGLRAVFTDIRPADSPQYLSKPELAGKTFDLVLALDVLEHILPLDRLQFLEQLDSLSNQYLLIAAPFSSAETESAEKNVRDSLLKAGVSRHGFLSEHADNGLPERDKLVKWIVAKNYSFSEVEGMSTQMWEILQKISLLLSYYRQYPTLEQLNRSVNREWLWASQGRPYRRFFLIAKGTPLDGSISSLPRGEPPAELLAFLEHEPEIVSYRTIRQHSDALFLLNETQKHVQLLENQVGLLQNQTELLENHTQLLENQSRLLENHMHTLETLLQAERQRPLAKIFWERLRKRIGWKHE